MSGSIVNQVVPRTPIEDFSSMTPELGHVRHKSYACSLALYPFLFFQARYQSKSLAFDDLERSIEASPLRRRSLIHISILILGISLLM